MFIANVTAIATMLKCNPEDLLYDSVDPPDTSTEQVRPNAPQVISGAVTGGKMSTSARAFDTHEEMAAHLKRICKAGDVLLFKGSRGMRMENVLEQFLKK